jgi:hypothetical protein
MNSSSSRTTSLLGVKKGVPFDHNKHSHGGQDQQALDTGVSIALTGGGKSAGKRRAGLMDDESCSDEDDDEDDIPRGRWSASCHAWLPVSNHSLNLTGSREDGSS